MITKIKSAGERAYHNFVKAAIIVIAFIICTATTVLAANSVIVSYVECDSETIKVVSFSSDIDDILIKADVEINDRDIIDLTDYVEGENGSIIRIHRVCKVTVTDGEKHYAVNIAGTVNDVIEKSGIKLNDGDRLNYDGETFIFEGMSIEVFRAFPVKVIADSKKMTVMMIEGETVSDALERAGVILGEDDFVNKGLTKKVTKDAKVVVKRVTYSTHKETETIHYNTVTEKDDTMYTNESKVKQKGVDGKQVVTYKDMYIDGKLEGSIVLKAKVKKAAQDKIVIVGTKSRPVVSVMGKPTISEFEPPADLEFDENGRPKTYKKLITGKATAYYCGTTCATGVHVQPGYIAVNPKQIPYGTKMYIVSSDGKYNYGYAIAADTGGFAKKGTAVADLFMWSEADCWEFGRRNVEIYILE